MGRDLPSKELSSALQPEKVFCLLPSYREHELSLHKCGDGAYICCHTFLFHNRAFFSVLKKEYGLCRQIIKKHSNVAAIMKITYK